MFKILKIAFFNCLSLGWGWLAKGNSNLGIVDCVRVCVKSMDSDSNNEFLKSWESSWWYDGIGFLFNLHVISELIRVLISVLIDDYVKWVASWNCKVEWFSFLKSLIELKIKPLSSYKAMDLCVTISQHLYFLWTISLSISWVTLAKTSCVTTSSMTTAITHIVAHDNSRIAIVSFITMTW